jgi:hypothetical protein
VLGLNPRFDAGRKEPLHSFVPESLDRHLLYCNPSRYGLQPGHW